MQREGEVPPDGNPGGQGDDEEVTLEYWVRRSNDYEQALKDALAAIKTAYGYVGSMLPERLDPVNASLHRQAMLTLSKALDRGGSKVECEEDL